MAAGWPDVWRRLWGWLSPTILTDRILIIATDTTGDLVVTTSTTDVLYVATETTADLLIETATTGGG